MAKAKAKAKAGPGPEESPGPARPRARGRPKKNPDVAAPAGPEAPRPAPDTRPKSATSRKKHSNVITLRGDTRWRDWVKRLAKHCRVDNSKLVERALIELAQRERFRPACPVRCEPR